MNERIIANSTAQHSTAQHSTAQHSTAQHSTASAKAAFCFDVILRPKTHIRLFEMVWIVLYVFFCFNRKNTGNCPAGNRMEVYEWLMRVSCQSLPKPKICAAI